MSLNEISVINNFCLSATESVMNELISMAANDEMSDDGILALARGLAASGNILKLPHNRIYGDMPSTGGPSSLSTLICPLILAEQNVYVPKLGVPGRPAGGIDVLCQIPNYQIFFDNKGIEKCLDNAKYCHFLVNDDYAPLDKLLFNYREKVGAKSLAPLVIASILSKKIVVGLNITGLDIRVSEFANFGQSIDLAKQNALRFIRVAKQAGIIAKCFLNDNSNLMQPYIGRGESLIALYKIFTNDFNNKLKDHYFKCVDMGMKLINEPDKVYFGINQLYKRFEYNLIAQGSSKDLFEEKVFQVEKLHIYQIISEKNGFLRIYLSKLRDTIVYYQNIANNNNLFFNDSCGVIFYKLNNDYVEQGEVILTYRVANYSEEFLKSLSQCFEIEVEYQQSIDYQIIE